jgi:hypothetical protein
LEFCFFFLVFFCQVWLQKESILFGLLKISHARFESAASGWQQPVVVVWGWRPTCSLSVSWHEEGFHGLGVQGAKLSTLPSASPEPSVAPASQPAPCFTELMLSAMSQSPFWIPLLFIQVFLLWGGISLSRRLCWFIPGVAKGYCMTPGSHLFDLPKVFQACLELVASWLVGGQ